jgi:hypothetical protein
LVTLIVVAFYVVSIAVFGDPFKFLIILAVASVVGLVWILVSNHDDE